MHCSSKPMLTLCDKRADNGEERWVGIGWRVSRVGVVVFTRSTGNVIRFISARRATREVTAPLPTRTSRQIAVPAGQR
ncbi:BrnT family toxin [Pseudomonas baltica]|uniref:BrnT family toxin n=1 Tax=Pseudomonas baltica TaxID=2762576 RepID=UPI0028986273|nr:BrnT family toxin [Pseudomonas baltica]